MLEKERSAPAMRSSFRRRWGAISAIAASALLGVLGYLLRDVIDAVESRSRQPAQEEELLSPVALNASAAPSIEAGRDGIEPDIDSTPDATTEAKSEASRSSDGWSSYAGDMAFYLGSFLGETPDIIGWNGYLSILATTVELDPASVSQSPEGLQGDFVIAGTDVKVHFTITDTEYKVESRSAAAADVLRDKEFSATLAFIAPDDVIEKAYGAVQFFPDDGQTYYEEGPVGYLYETSAAESSYRPIRGEMRDGQYWVLVPPATSDQKLPAGGLDSAYHWMDLLKEVKRSNPLRDSSRR